MKIEEVRKALVDFLKETLKKDGTIVKLSKTPEGWEAEVEVIEESEYIKALKIPTRVLDRNIYEVKLNDQLEVISYERIEQHVLKKSA